MEPNFTYTELKAIFYEWFYITFPEKFSELSPIEKKAVCEANFKQMLDWQEKGLSVRQFPSLKPKEN